MGWGFLKGLTAVSVHHQRFQGVNKRGVFLFLRLKTCCEEIWYNGYSCGCLFYWIGVSWGTGNSKIREVRVFLGGCLCGGDSPGGLAAVAECLRSDLGSVAVGPGGHSGPHTRSSSVH